MNNLNDQDFQRIQRIDIGYELVASTEGIPVLKRFSAPHRKIEFYPMFTADQGNYVAKSNNHSLKAYSTIVHHLKSVKLRTLTDEASLRLFANELAKMRLFKEHLEESKPILGIRV